MTDLPQRVLFLCPARYSLGEVHNAVIAARQLQHAEIFFCVTKPFESYVCSAGFPTALWPTGIDALRVVRDQMEAFAPDLVIVADHHVLGIERNNTVTFASLAELVRAPMVTFDSLLFARSVARLQTSVADLVPEAGLDRWFPETIELPEVPEGVGILRPAPVACSRHAGAFALYTDAPKHCGRELVRAEIGCRQDEVMVVLAQSAWARLAFDLVARLNRRSLQPGFHALLVEWLGEAFRRLGRPTRIVMIGGQDGPDPNPLVAVTRLPTCSNDRFTDIVSAADLYLTDNVTSAGMARAVRCGTPGAALVNIDSRRSTDEFSARWFDRVGARFPGFDFPFVVNPFGWRDELAPLLADNPYFAALPTASIFDMDDVVRTVSAGLGQRDGPATQALIADQAKLPSFEQALTGCLA